MTKKNYTHMLETEDMEKLRKIGRKEERSLAWLIRKLVKYGVNNWDSIKEVV